MSKRFLIADTHFGDEKIMNYENRPFADVTQGCLGGYHLFY